MSRLPAPLAALGLAVLLPSLGTSIANVALPELVAGFDASFAQVQWVVVAYLAAVMALVVVAGRVGDRFGRRRVLIAGIGLFTCASAAAAFAPGLGVLVSARALQGAGAAAVMALAVALVGDAVPGERAGSAVGLLGTVSAVGTALGPSLGGILLAGFGWPAVFAAMAAAGAAAFVLGLALFPADRLRAPAPPLRLSLLRDRSLPAALVALASVSAILMTTLVVGPFYLAEAGLDPVGIGLVMTIGPGIAAAAGVPGGRLVDRVGASVVSVAGLAGIVAGSLLMVLLPAAVGVGGYAGALAVITAGYALFQAANTTAVLRRAPESDRGVAAGLVGLARNAGLVAGASAMGAAFAFGSRGPAGATSGLQLAFTIAAALGAACLVLQRWSGRNSVP